MVLQQDLEYLLVGPSRASHTLHVVVAHFGRLLREDFHVIQQGPVLSRELGRFHFVARHRVHYALVRSCRLQESRVGAHSVLALVDRRYSRHIPVSADYVGIEVDSIASQKVVVSWKETDGEDRITLISEAK